MAAPLPLAAGEWLEALLPFLFLLFWVVSQIRNLFKAANQGRPQGPVVVRPVARPAADDERQREITRQVEEFLRRASAEKDPAARRPAGQRPRGPVPSPRAATPPPLPGAPPARPPRQPVRETRGARPSVTPAAAPPPALGSLGGHGGDVARHVGDAFAHEMRHLEPGVGRTADADATAARAVPVADIAALLRNPATLRQMLLVREVLDRPVDRW
ncbi:MAG: hypothetical protein ACKOZU_03840 [Planctomycetaceae bacterium]